MIYRLLAFSLCLQSAWACVPVRPGEDLPCPPVPLAAPATAPLFVVSGLKGPNVVNGAKVYSCMAPEKLIEVDGATVTPLTSDATISCKPSSGQFVLDMSGAVVGSKKYTCGVDLVKCPTLTDAPAIGPPPMVEVTPVVEADAANGDKVWSCAAPSQLYEIVDGNAMMNTNKKASTVVCKKQSGKLTYDDGTMIDDMTRSFACGTLGCQKCDTAKIIDQTNGACNTQTGIFCKGKPTVTPGGDNCPIIACTMDNLFLITSTTASMPADPASVMCDAGTWKISGTAIPADAIGFVCAKAANCLNCEAKRDAAFAGTGILLSTEAKPTCTYECPGGSSMLFNAKSRKSVTCNMDTEVIMTDAGDMVSMNAQFSCFVCMCMVGSDVLTDGDLGSCPKDKLCTFPTAPSMCEATCPADSTPVYIDTTSGMSKTATEIKCFPGDIWIEMGVDPTAGITCQFADGKGYTSTKPTNPTCAQLPTFQCAPGVVCDPMQLIYYPSGEGYAATCKSGALVTDASSTDPIDIPVVHCDASGSWDNNIQEINCMTDENAAKSCKDQLPTGVTTSCAFGRCYFSCPANMQFEYELGGIVTKNKNLRCYLGSTIITANGVAMGVDDPMGVKCVAL